MYPLRPFRIAEGRSKSRLKTKVNYWRVSTFKECRRKRNVCIFGETKTYSRTQDENENTRRNWIITSEYNKSLDLLGVVGRVKTNSKRAKYKKRYVQFSKSYFRIAVWQ